jgi:hypothetical protein
MCGEVTSARDASDELMLPRLWEMVVKQILNRREIAEPED